MKSLLCSKEPFEQFLSSFLCTR